LFSLTKYERILALFFLLSLPLCNPWVHGDGVGYYAYVRALVVERHLNFEKDWQRGNESFAMGRVDADGKVRGDQYTSTGHLDNLWTIGPSILWSPFLIATHLGVLLCDRLGARIAADGFSAPYLVTMACATALYGFLGLWISFSLARQYFEERWAFLATLGIWGGSSLPVYMYFNPSWSHAHSAFAVALFLWYWHRTKDARTLGQWIVLGLLSGLMVNVYYPNGVFLLIPLLEAINGYWRGWKSDSDSEISLPRLFLWHLAYFVTFLLALLPTLISREIIFGSPFRTGYMAANTWRWTSPAFVSVLFSSDHGLLSWTPILILSSAGLVLFCRLARRFGIYLCVCTVCYYLVISFYPDWDGLSSFGNRFFVSLTPVFVVGLAAFFDFAARAWVRRRAFALISAVTAVFILWNGGLIFQWGTHLIPARGPISFREAAYNQVAVVPQDVARTLKMYFMRRRNLMDRIEQQDVRQIKQQQSGSPPGRE
jgi:hypothetical protein